MLSRKNYKETIRKQTPTKQYYTIKKLTVGVTSVLIGLSFMGELEGDSVHADTMTASSESTSVTSTTAQDGLKKSPQLYLQVTDTNNPSTPLSASSTGTSKNVTSSAAVQVKSASDEEDSDSTLAKGENKFARSAVKDSVTDGKTSTAEINPAKLSSPALITQLNQSLAKSSTSDAAKANDELEIKATDPTNYPNCGDVYGPLFELDASGQLVNKDEVISLKDMYIFQILKLVNTKDSDFQYVILTMNRKDTADRSVYLFVTGSNYSNAVVVKVKPNDTYELSKTGYSVTYTEPTTINGHYVDGTFYVTGSTYDDGFIMPDWQLQHLQIIYSLGNYDPSNTDATSVCEIMPSYEKVPVIKYSGVPSNISQPKVYITGFTGQEFNVTDIINNYKKVFKGYYLQNPNVASMGTLSQFENGGYYLKTYYDNDGNVDFKGLYHQIDDQGTMSVSVLNADNKTIVGPENILAGKSHNFNFNGHNWIARNPYVTSSAHEVILKYAKLGSVIPVDENGNKINDGWQYVNDPDDASKATSPYEKAPVIDGYVAVNPDETIVLPHNLSSDTKIYYRKRIKVTYSGSDSKTYDGNPANFEPTTVQWSGLKGLNTSTLTSADFTWNTADKKAPTDAGKYTLSLNTTGEAALRKANPNYDLKTISGSYTYTINPLGIDKVTYSGSDSKTYDGNPANFEPTTVQWSGLKGLNTSTLTSADFTWNTADKKAPTDAGKYTLSLNTTGEAALRKANPNYDLKTISGSYTYTINPLGIDKVTYSGSDSKTYDGNPANFEPTTVQWSGLKGLNTSTLTSADFTWNTADKKAPTDAGKYTLSLNTTGEAALRKANPNYDLKTISGSYTYTINPLGIDKVTYSGSDSKTYDGNPANFEPTTVQWSGLKGLNTSTLTSADFTWNTADKKAPTDAGKYTLSLNTTGEAALRKANPNYDLKTISGSYTYTINPLGIVTVNYKGYDKKVYDGQPGTINPGKLTWSKLPDGTSLKMPTWSIDDFAWETADGLAPTAVGTYRIILTDAGKAALKKINPNYDLSSITGVFTYEIKPAQTPEILGQTPEQQPGQNTNQSGAENGFGSSTRPNASTNSNLNQLPQTGNEHSNTALAGLALAFLTAMLGLGKKRKHD
ncbi:Lar_0958 family LPXTG-anchored mucus adhesin [Limosilactobacillus reuteri]|uniref:Lar_0958 family LPXTG-anchored mucus adhesin n=1 Tax=Limosilactobacillus reuteri TaxID=1598 RepID=UPI0034D1AD66